jgi:predicted CXXCH cytochrome family protein
MHQHKPQQRVDQLALFRASVHGKRLAADHTGGAECVDCHGVHNIRAISDPLSPANPRHVAETCAKCHTATAELFQKSPHGAVFTSQKMAGCTVCHASHATEPASRAMLTGKNAVCRRCHSAGSAGGKAAAEIARLIAGLEAAGPGSNEALARARVAVHTFDVAAIRRAAEPIMAGREAGRK